MAIFKIISSGHHTVKSRNSSKNGKNLDKCGKSFPKMGKLFHTPPNPSETGKTADLSNFLRKKTKKVSILVPGFLAYNLHVNPGK